MAQQYDKEPEKDAAIRTGALAMLIHSISTYHTHTQQDLELTWTS
jgi:hypothetical protein